MVTDLSITGCAVASMNTAIITAGRVEAINNAGWTIDIGRPTRSAMKEPNRHHRRVAVAEDRTPRQNVMAMRKLRIERSRSCAARCRTRSWVVLASEKL